MTDAEKLFSKVKTLQEGEELTQALEVLSASKVAKNYLSFEIISTLNSIGKINNFAGLKDAFKKILFHTQTVSLTLSFYPSKGMLERMAKWFEENMGKRVLIDLKIDAGVIAGAELMCNEHFKDYTLRSKLEKLQILEVSNLAVQV